jgi:hypothetical protein
MVGLAEMNSKDFYIGTSFICGIRTPDNIFDLPKYMFGVSDFLEFEGALRMYTKGSGVKLYLWPWMWQDSSMTDEVIIYDIETDRIIYYQSGLRDFFDAKLVMRQQSLEGCEVFDFKFQFPKMLNVPPVITAMQRGVNEKDHTKVLSTVWEVL